MRTGAAYFHRAGRSLAVAVTLGVLLTLGALASGCRPGSQPAHRFNGQAVEPVEPAPPLAGTNWDGGRFELTDVRGKVAVVFFGYTFCPDVCPFTLAKMKQVQAGLGARADDLAVVFVSVDPHRDSVDKLSRYVPNFDQRFYGLRLEFDELEAVQEAWDVTVQYGQPADGPGTDSFYYVDHTGTYFVVDRAGDLRLTFPPNAAAGDMVPDLEHLLAAGPATAAADPDPEILEPRALAMPNGMGAVYLSVKTPDGAPDRLLSVATSAARAAETHESVEDGGVVRMVHHPEGFEVPAGGDLVLEPGGKHIMLLDLRLAQGARTIPLTLRFERAGPVEIEAVLESIGGMDHGGMDHGGTDHGGTDHGGTDHGGMDHGGTDHGGDG